MKRFIAGKAILVSSWFKSSMADRLLADVNVPLFIAHKK